MLKVGDITKNVPVIPCDFERSHHSATRYFGNCADDVYLSLRSVDQAGLGILPKKLLHKSEIFLRLLFEGCTYKHILKDVVGI